MTIFFWTIFMEYGPQWCIQQGVLCCSKQKLKGESEKLGKLSLSCIHNKQLYCQIGDLMPNWQLLFHPTIGQKQTNWLVQNCFMQKQKAELKARLCFVFNRGGIKPWRSPDKRVRPNPFLFTWVTYVSTNPKPDIQYSQYWTPRLVENCVYEAANIILNNQISHGDG